MILYNLKTEGLDFRITKFDDDLNPESSYLVNESACECPQGHKSTCRHRKMLPHFLNDRAVRADTAWFFNYDDRTWHLADGSEEPQATGTDEPAPSVELMAPSVAQAPSVAPSQAPVVSFRRRI